MHVQKFTRGSMFGLLSHIERRFNNHSNENIDLSKKCDDYIITQEGQKAPLDSSFSSKKRYDEIISRCKVQNRRDVNTLVSVCLHTPKDLPPQDELLFFQVACKFLKERYCQNDNFVAAVVHKDETTPHLHFVFVPAVVDKKKNRLKVCAKDVVNRKDLTTLHKDLSDRYKRVFGRDIGIYSNAPQNDLQGTLRRFKNKIPPKEYKALIDDFKALQKYLLKLRKQVAALENFISELTEQDEELTNRHKELSDKCAELESTINKLKNSKLYQEYVDKHIGDSLLDDDFPSEEEFARCPERYLER